MPGIKPDWIAEAVCPPGRDRVKVPRRLSPRAEFARVMPLSRDQHAEIDRQRAESAPTRRPVAPALEEMLYQAHAGARPRLRAGHRLYGRRRGGGAGGPRLLRQAAPRRSARTGA